MYEFHFSFIFVSVVEKGKTLESNELGLEDFEDVINKTLRETGDSDLDKLIRNFIQSRSPLNITEVMEVVHFISNENMLRYIDIYIYFYIRGGAELHFTELCQLSA